MKIKQFILKHKLIFSFSIFLFCFGLFLLLFLRMDIDYFWHFKAGEYMVRHSTILTHDVFSWSLFSYPWISHEWLFEIILYSLYLVFGKYHLFIYVFFSISTCFTSSFFFYSKHIGIFESSFPYIINTNIFQNFLFGYLILVFANSICSISVPSVNSSFAFTYSLAVNILIPL